MLSSTSSTTSSFADLGLAGKRCLFVASTGGHLAQLSRIIRTMDAHPASRVVTFDSPQARSLPVDLAVETVPYIAPRDLRNTVGAVASFARLLRRGDYDAVVSTGAAIAAAALPTAVALRTRAIYIESYSRFEGPSATGRLLAATPGVERYTQHRSWSRGRWAYSGSIMDTVVVGPQAVADERPRDPHKVFVTLGTIRPYRFDALVDRIKQLLPPAAEVTWQLGVTDRSDLPGAVHTQMTRSEFLDAASSSGTIVSHAGTGSAVEFVEMGHLPVIVPRRAHRNEHVDDHQLLIGRDLASRSLAVLREVDELGPDDLQPSRTRLARSA